MDRCWIKSAVFVLALVFMWGLLPAGLGGSCASSETCMYMSGKWDAAESPGPDEGAGREEFLKQARSALEELDGRIESFRHKMEEKWEEMKPLAREKAEQTLETMRKKRKELYYKLDRLKESSEDAWMQMKKEFLENYESLKEEFEKTLRERPEDNIDYI